MSTALLKKTVTSMSKGIDWPEALKLYEMILRSARKSPRTIYCYLGAIGHVRDQVNGDGRSVLPGEVTLQDLRTYQVGLYDGTTSQKGRPLAASSVSRVTTTISGFFSCLVAEEKIERDPTLKLDQPRKCEPPLGEVLSVKETERFLAAPDDATPKGLRDRALIEVFYGSGIRLSEALGLDLGDLNHEEREVRVLGKGGKRRVVPVTRSAWSHLVTYIERARPTLSTSHTDSSKAIFLSTLGRRMCGQSVLVMFHENSAVAKIKKNVTPHCLRRTCATHLLKNGVNVRFIQMLLGHSSLNTTARYLKLDANELRRQILLHHPRERFE